MLHGLGEPWQGQGVQYVVLGEPGAARLQYSKANLLHVRGVVGIGIDHDLHAVLFCQPQMTVRKIEPVRICIQFHRHFILRRFLQDRIDVERIGIATEQQAAGRVPQQAKRWDSGLPSAAGRSFLPESG